LAQEEPEARALKVEKAPPVLMGQYLDYTHFSPLVAAAVAVTPMKPARRLSTEPWEETEVRAVVVEEVATMAALEARARLILETTGEMEIQVVAVAAAVALVQLEQTQSVAQVVRAVRG
jgi:gentisate 1,2-dioxygenase